MQTDKCLREITQTVEIEGNRIVYWEKDSLMQMEFDFEEEEPIITNHSVLSLEPKRPSNQEIVVAKTQASIQEQEIDTGLNDLVRLNDYMATLKYLKQSKQSSHQELY